MRCRHNLGEFPGSDMEQTTRQRCKGYLRLLTDDPEEMVEEEITKDRRALKEITTGNYDSFRGKDDEEIISEEEVNANDASD